MSCFAPCGDFDLVNGIPASTPATPPSAVEWLWEADLTDQGTVIFADGPQDIVGLDGTVLTGAIANTDRAASGAAADWGFDSNGMNWLANTTASQWVAGTQTASRWTIPTATLLTTFDLDYTMRFVVELYFTLATLATGNPDIGIGFAGVASTPANAGNRMWCTKRGLRAGVQVSLTELTGGASSNYTTAPGPTADVIATQMFGNAFMGLIGNATVGPPFVWPRLRTIVSAGSQGDTTLNTLSASNLTISFSNGNSVAGTSRFRANRIRLGAGSGIAT